MAIKYVKNCTGDECDEQGSSHGSRKVSRLVSKIIFFVLLIGFIAVTTYVLFFSQYLQIINVEVSGTKELNASDIKQKIEATFQEKYFGVISKNNFMFVSQKNISNDLMSDFKKIRTVSVTKKFPDSVSVNIDERKALLIWCSLEDCYLLDEKGAAYLQADFNSPEVVQNNLLKITDASGREVAIGDNVVDQEYEKYALGISDALKSVGLDVTGEYLTLSRMSDEIRVKTMQGPEILLSMQFPISSSMETLASVLKKEITDDKKGEIEYIDLRNENKVFYKFKTAQPVAEGAQI
jgi:cell division septal protein FtsQ